MVSAFAVGGLAPAQARDTGWDLKAPRAAPSVTASPGRASDTGWD